MHHFPLDTKKYKVIIKKYDEKRKYPYSRVIMMELETMNMTIKMRDDFPYSYNTYIVTHNNNTYSFIEECYNGDDHVIVSKNDDQREAIINLLRKERQIVKNNPNAVRFCEIFN